MDSNDNNGNFCVFLNVQLKNLATYRLEIGLFKEKNEKKKRTEQKSKLHLVCAIPIPKRAHGEIYKFHTSVISTHLFDQVQIFFFFTHCIVIKVRLETNC